MNLFLRYCGRRYKWIDTHIPFRSFAKFAKGTQWKPQSGESIVDHQKYSAVYQGSTPEIYDEWAADGYDKDVGAVSVAVPSISAKLLSLLEAKALTASSKQEFKVMDAGCGTGCVGESCVKRAKEISSFAAVATLEFDGLDFSQGMLDVARDKGCYGRLEQADLKQPLSAFADCTYDAVTCSGVFLQGHVGAEAIPELARILKPGGVMVFSVRPNFFSETKSQWLDALEDSGCDVLSTDMLPYTKNMDAPYLSCRKRE